MATANSTRSRLNVSPNSVHRLGRHLKIALSLAGIGCGLIMPASRWIAPTAMASNNVSNRMRIGQTVGEGHRLSLKFSSRWEPLTAAALDWETSCPNLLLETLSISRSAGLQTSAPYLESTLSYFVITEN